MRMTLASISTNAALLTVLGLPSLAAAQDAAPAAPAPAAAAATPAPAPAAAPEAAPTPAPETAPAAAAAPAAPAAEEEKPVPSYFRIDHDYMFGLQLWAGATYPITDKIGLATDIYIAENYPFASLIPDATGAPAGIGVSQSWWGEFDIGPAFTFGPLAVTPMVGIAFDWYAKRAVAINGPQLYTIVNTDKIYFESWIWTMLYSAFAEPPAYSDYFHTRNWVLYKATKNISLGPQFEFTYALNDKVVPKGTLGMPLGGHVELAYGAGNSLGLFLGYELDKDVRAAVGDRGAVGRLTFVHNF